MKVMIYETTLATPHTETSIELAILHSLAGDKVVYFPAYRFLTGDPFASNINGDPMLPRAISDWDNFITSSISKFSDVWTPDFVYEESPDRFCSEAQLNEFILRACNTLFPGLKLTDRIVGETITLFDLVSSATRLSFKLALVSILQVRPDRIYCFNGRTPATWPMYKTASYLGVECLYHERGSSFDKYAIYRYPVAYNSASRDLYERHRVGKDIPSAKLDSAYFYNIQKKGLLQNFGFTERVFSDDFPAFLGEQEPFVLFLCSSDSEIETVPDQDCYFDSLPSQTACINLVRNVCIRLGIKFIVRMHPVNLDKKHPMLSLHDGENCFVIPPESQISSYFLGSRALAIFSVGTTVGFELMFRGFDCALMAKSIVFNEPEAKTVNSAEQVEAYILSKPCAFVVPEFIYLLGDFYLNYGNKYRLFRPTGHFSGSFDFSPVT